MMNDAIEVLREVNSVFSFITFLMNCFVWNCRGADSPTFLRTIRFYIQNYNPSCIDLLVNRAKNIFKNLGFDNFIFQEGVGIEGEEVFGLHGSLIFSQFFPIIVIIILFFTNWRTPSGG